MIGRNGTALHPVAGVVYGLATSASYACFLLILRQTAGDALHVAGQLFDATAGAVRGCSAAGADIRRTESRNSVAVAVLATRANSDERDSRLASHHLVAAAAPGPSVGTCSPPGASWSTDSWLDGPSPAAELAPDPRRCPGVRRRTHCRQEPRQGASASSGSPVKPQILTAALSLDPPCKQRDHFWFVILGWRVMLGCPGACLSRRSHFCGLSWWLAGWGGRPGTGKLNGSPLGISGGRSRPVPQNAFAARQRELAMDVRGKNRPGCAMAQVNGARGGANCRLRPGSRSRASSDVSSTVSSGVAGRAAWFSWTACARNELTCSVSSVQANSADACFSKSSCAIVAADLTRSVIGPGWSLVWKPAWSAPPLETCIHAAARPDLDVSPARLIS